MIRYHSFYPWHREGAYRHLMNADDEADLYAVKAFNREYFTSFSSSKRRPLRTDGTIADDNSVRPVLQVGRPAKGVRAQGLLPGPDRQVLPGRGRVVAGRPDRDDQSARRIWTIEYATARELGGSLWYGRRLSFVLVARHRCTLPNLPSHEAD